MQAHAWVKRWARSSARRPGRRPSATGRVSLRRLPSARLERSIRLRAAGVRLRNRLFGMGVFLAFATFGGATPAYIVLEWPGFVAAVPALLWAVVVAWALRNPAPLRRLSGRLAAQEQALQERAEALRQRDNIVELVWPPRRHTRRVSTPVAWPARVELVG